MVKLLSYFNSDMKGMLPYVAKTYEADVSKTEAMFNWKSIPFEKMVLDTAHSVNAILEA
jgi:hypothetical protein